MNSRKCWQSLDPSELHFEPGEFDGIGMDLLKDLRDFYIQTRGGRWEEGFASAIRLMRKHHDHGAALRELYEVSREAARSELINEIKNDITASFKSVLHTIELYHGMLKFDSLGSNIVYPVRMWYTKEFMNDLKIK